MGDICVENWAESANKRSVASMFLVALAVGLGLVLVDVYDLANRHRTH